MNFKSLTLLTLATLSTLVSAGSNDGKLTITVRKQVANCPYRTQPGDTVKVHYRGALEDGTEFDASYNRGQPISFRLGVGQVIQGWDEGLLEMCVGEQRDLVIPPSMAYGDRGAGGLIPPRATLFFSTELVEVLPARDEL
ncbi:unnamed protein product [Ambrosiozyma monospora]|uniref:peptidylprolyl isomerase n=1 Tax=Ambrosiozyma monospora TaxID=43982 RepID=A0A9W6YWQ9_AMBMO|nr:unnamed protein product [Ambrosiozyma monospora]